MDGRRKRKYNDISDNAVQNHVLEENPDLSAPCAINTLVHRRVYSEDGLSVNTREIEPRKELQNNDYGMHATINLTATDHYVSDRCQVHESYIVRFAFKEYCFHLVQSLREGL